MKIPAFKNEKEMGAPTCKDAQEMKFPTSKKENERGAPRSGNEKEIKPPRSKMEMALRARSLGALPISLGML